MGEDEPTITREVLSESGMRIAKATREAYVNATTREDQERILAIHEATKQFLILSISYLEGL